MHHSVELPILPSGLRLEDFFMESTANEHRNASISLQQFAKRQGGCVVGPNSPQSTSRRWKSPENNETNEHLFIESHVTVQ